METTAETTTPAEYVQLRDQLTLDLGAIVSVRAHARRSAEYLLSSGLVPLSTIRARYDETHPAPEGDGDEVEREAPVTVERADDQSTIPVGAIYLDSDQTTARWRLRKTEAGWEWQNNRAGADDPWFQTSASGLHYPLILESVA